jgi:hypothetical protein
LVVVVGIVFVVAAFNVEAVLVRLLRLQQATLERALPEDLPAEERQRYQDAWESLYRAIGEGEVDPEAHQRLQRHLMDAAGGPDRRLTRERVQRLTEALEAAAAGELPPELEPRREPAEPGLEPAPARPPPAS